MGTSQNLPVAVRVVRCERGFVGDDLGTRHGVIPRADFECLALSFDRFGAGTSVGFGADSGAVMGMPQLWQKIIFSGVIFYAVSGCVGDV